MLIIIGDIHGCFDELHDLLDRIGPGADDAIVSVGDLVDRGPDPVGVVRFFRDTPNAYAVMGNHEDKHLRIASEGLTASRSQIVCQQQAGDAYGEILDYASQLPTYLDLPEALVVHAGYEPDLPLGEQPRNVLLRAKWPGERGLGGDFTKWVGRYSGERPVVYGHTTFRAPNIVGRTFGIDTGVYAGGMLTGLVLPDERLVSVHARAHHWRAVRAAYDDSSARAPSQQLVDEALALIEQHLARPPVPLDADRRRALAAALSAHPHGQDLRRFAFARDRRAAVVETFRTSAKLAAVVARMASWSDDHEVGEG